MALLATLRASGQMQGAAVFLSCGSEPKSRFRAVWHCCDFTNCQRDGICRNAWQPTWKGPWLPDGGQYIVRARMNAARIGRSEASAPTTTIPPCPAECVGSLDAVESMPSFADVILFVASGIHGALLRWTAGKLEASWDTGACIFLTVRKRLCCYQASLHFEAFAFAHFQLCMVQVNEEVTSCKTRIV